MNIIQKLAATLNAIRPIILIVHKTLFYLLIQPMAYDAEYKI